MLAVFPDFLLNDISGLRLSAQKRMPAPHPPKAPPFVALPAQPKIPQPASSAVTPSTATASLRRRQLHAAPAVFLARSNISYHLANLRQHKTFNVCS
jgi:hypothetical protein